MPALGRFQSPVLIALIVLAGMLLALAAQPPPATSAAGWSAVRVLAPVDLRDVRSILLGPDQSFHLAWPREGEDVSQVFAARMSLAGEWLAAPRRVSTAGVRSLSPSLATLPDGTDLIAYVDKARPVGALALAVGREQPRRAVEAAGDMRQPALAGDAARGYFAAWSENRDGQPAIYLAGFNPHGETVFRARRASPEPALAVEPVLLVNEGGVHLFYFSDDNRYVDLRYRIFEPDGSPLGEAAVLSHRLQTGSTSTYPVVVRGGAGGFIYLFEVIGGVARLSRFDAGGAALDAMPVVLDRVRNAGSLDVQVEGDTLWVCWSGPVRRDRPPQIVARPFDLKGRSKGAETRLTFSTSGSFQPVCPLDHAGVRHLFWVENTGDREAALFYANTARGADLSLWQRLGFGGADGFAQMGFTLAAAFMYVIPLQIANAWRLLLVCAALLAAQRLTGGRIEVMLAVFVASVLVCYAPEQEFLGQPRLALSSLAHWTFAATATAVVLRTLTDWRREMSETLRWPALAFVWSYLYYWLNTIVLLREAYAV